MTSKISEGIRLQYHTAEKMKLFAFRFYVLYDERKCVINSKTSNKYRNKMSTMRRVEFYGASATFRTWKSYRFFRLLSRTILQKSIESPFSDNTERPLSTDVYGISTISTPSCNFSKGVKTSAIDTHSVYWERNDGRETKFSFNRVCSSYLLTPAT